MLLSSELGDTSATAVEEADGCTLASHQEAMVRCCAPAVTGCVLDCHVETIEIHQLLVISQSILLATNNNIRTYVCFVNRGKRSVRSWWLN